MATLVEVVALNALSVSRWARGVDRVNPGSCESENFRGRGFPSSEPRTSQNTVEGAPSSYACGLDRRIRIGGALIRSFRGFLGRRFLKGFLLSIAGFGYP
jgi:hypothetical protein